MVALEDRVRLEVQLDVEVARAGRRSRPARPRAASRIRSPASTPAGIFTASVLCAFTRPAPPQALHGSAIIRPVPWQRGQVCWIEKKPCCMRTWPCPPQVAQVCGFVPGLAPLPWQVEHVSWVGMRILVSVPCAACSSVISRL